MGGLRLEERTLTKNELTNAARVASKAFFNDPFFRFLSPNDRLRDRASRSSFGPTSSTRARGLD